MSRTGSTASSTKSTGRDDLARDAAIRNAKKSSKPPSVITLSDGDSSVEAVDEPKASSSKPRRAKPEPTKVNTADSDASVVAVDYADRRPSKGKAKSGARARKDNADDMSSLSELSEPEDESSGKKGRKGKAKGKGKNEKGGDGDYRGEKWKGLETPLAVTPKVKLRPHFGRRRKSSNLDGGGDTTSRYADEGSGLDPVNMQYPPTVWVEVFSKPFQRWLTVDPIRGLVFATGNRYMEPVASDRQNKLIYVVAFEEDGYARDVTPRYTRTLNSRIAKMRPPPSKDGMDWWESVVAAISRPYSLDRDAVEDAELEDTANREPMPTSVAGFKDHPVYAIEKHLKRDEVIYPATRVGTFQNLPVYLRSNVVQCRSARQWMNEGRSVKNGEEPLKLVKSRAYTIENKRVQEAAKLEGAEAPQEGLYGRFQTEIYRPPPVVDGKIPTNAFGNIDLYVPTMLPEGAAHIPYNGSGKIAKKLGIPYAEAVVSKLRRAITRQDGLTLAALCRSGSSSASSVACRRWEESSCRSNTQRQSPRHISNPSRLRLNERRRRKSSAP